MTAARSDESALLRWLRARGGRALLACALVAAGCGDASVALDRAGHAPNAGADEALQRCFGANDCPPGYECNTFGYCSPMSTDAASGRDDAGLPPEVEEVQDMPQSGERHVYVAIAEQDAVIKIDSETLRVQTVKVGDNPGALRTVSGKDVALLLNRGEATATLLTSRDDGTDEIVTMPTAAGLNSLAVSPDGRFGLAYFDVARSGGAMAPQQTFQDVTLLRLLERKAVNLSVGFRPSGVQFSADGQRAFVITAQGVSVVDLGNTRAPAIMPTISYFHDPLTEPEPAEVQVTPDGKLALLRRPGLLGIRAVSLDSGKIRDVLLGGEPTDLDLADHGKLALVVLRDRRQLALLPLPAALDDPALVETISSQHAFGQATLTDDGARAFLFSNASDDEVLLVADLAQRSLSVHRLEKGVRAVRPAPGGRVALVLHNRKPGEPQPTDDLETFIDKHCGYSLIDVASGFVKLQLTETDPGESAFEADGRAGYLVVADRTRGIRSVEAIDLDSFLVERFALASHPAGIGLVPATAQVYVAQDHPLGRVTFIDPKSRQTRTLTGFALNSQVIE